MENKSCKVKNITKWLKEVLRKKDVKIHVDKNDDSSMDVTIEHDNLKLRLIIGDNPYLSFHSSESICETYNKDKVSKVSKLILSYFNVLIWKVIKTADFITECSKLIGDKPKIKKDKQGRLKRVKYFNVTIKKKNNDIVIKDELFDDKFKVKQYDNEFVRLLYRDVKVLAPVTLYKQINRVLDKIEEELVD